MVIEGTLAYISPEQTGRMNRSIDYRTDYYSMGASFYELFTGKQPLTVRTRWNSSTAIWHGGARSPCASS